MAPSGGANKIFNIKNGLGKLKKNKTHFDGFNPQWGGGVSVRIHCSRIFFTFNVKNMSKNWKRTIKQW